MPIQDGDRLANMTDLKAVYDELNYDKVSKSQVVDSLTSTSTTQPLSAAQGKELNDQIANIGGTLMATGIIADGDSDTGIKGYGRATVLLLNGTAVIVFAIKVTEAAEGSSGGFGINASLLKSITSTIPTITPSPGGQITYIDTEGKYSDYNGYAGTIIVSGTRWLFSRIHNTSGANGKWASNAFGVGRCVFGTIYGTYA